MDVSLAEPEKFSYEKRLVWLLVFSLEQMRLKGDVNALLNTVKREGIV